MLNASKSVIVNFTQVQMFNLVNDVDKYQDFLPLCSSSTVISRNHNSMLASLSFQYGLINCSFTTQNYLVEQQAIKMDLVKGAFKSLSGSWQFIAQTDGKCKVQLEVSFLSTNKLVQLTLTKSLDKAINLVINAFVDRAYKVYAVDICL